MLMSSPPRRVLSAHATEKDLSLIVISLVVITAAVGALTASPEHSKMLAEQWFDTTTRWFGSWVQMLGFASVVIAFALAFSKYGHIRLGTGAPEYTNTGWVFMFICAGLGSATMYWAFMEWGYYYLTPGLNIAPASKQALEFSIAYSFFHWGITPWAMYAIASLAMAYHFHVRRNEGLSLSSVMQAITGLKAKGPAGRAIDLIFLLATFGGLVLTITLTTSTVSRGLADLLGLTDGFMLKAGLVILVTLVFSLTSFVGIASGMQRLAKVACALTLLFGLIVLILGPTQFAVSNITNGIGLMLQHFVQMSLATDPTGNGDFPRGWTAFYWLYWTTYTPGVAIFVTRVSRGRTVREVILAMILGGCAGCWFFFGSLESFAIHQFITGLIDSPAILSSGGGEAGVSMLLISLPWGKLMAALYFLLMLVFLASHLDAVSFTVAATSTRNLREGDDPAPGLRVFWCVMLAALPTAMLYINAPLTTLKTAVTLAAIPFILVLVVMMLGLFRWLRQDYGNLTSAQIESQSREWLSSQPAADSVRISDAMSGYRVTETGTA
ncbi:MULTISPECIES: BCCT family transporter [Pseudomonas]|uniref:BCCT family transporter n=1 Tax=Pseudomonas TaxID=286 RepID=UPI00111BF85B|nr:MULTISPECIES: BCCT family transporter [Pseudomonas]UIN54033.1 BCCT family transporter [Pseudomonas kribbensis]